MSFNANDQKGGGGGDFVDQEALDPSVTYPARIVQLVLMGVQPQRPYNGVAKDPQERLYVGYELSHEFCKDEDGNIQADQPRWLGEDFPFYSLEADRATSTKRYHAIDATGQYGGDWLKMIAAPCQLTLTKEPRKNGKGDTNYVSNVSGPLAVPGYTQPELVNPPRIFDFYNPDMEVFAKLPKWLQERIKGAVNYPGSALEAKLKETNNATTAQAPAPAPAPTPAPAPAAPAAPVPTEAAPAGDAPTTAPVAPVAPPAPPAAPPAPPAPPSA